MGMGARCPIAIPMTDPAALLKLTQWLSPAFPVGGFAYSHGLEAEIQAGRVGDAASLQAWLAAVLRHGSGLADAVLLARALEPENDLAEVALYAAALCASKERWDETNTQGRAFAVAVRQAGGDGFEAPLPVAVAAAARGLNLIPAVVLPLYVQAFAGNITSAAVRAIPIGASQGQKVMAALHPLILHVAKAAQTTPLTDIRSSSFGADMGAMEHEILQVRMFKS
jgi:urease accessory protein